MTETPSTTRRAWLWVAAVAVGVAVGQSGCGSGGAAPAGPAAASVSTPTPRPTPRKVMVVFAAAPLAIGRAIERKAVEVREVPEAEAPTESYPSNPDEVVGKIAATDVLAGTPLVRRLFRETKIRGLADMISPGMRGVSIRMNAVLAGPFLRSGHKVDVIGTFDERTEDSFERVTRVLIRGAKVLAVDIKFDPGAAPGGSQASEQESRGKEASEQIQGFENPYKGKEQVRCVVLEVPPAEATKLTQCSFAIDLHLAMCGDLSGSEVGERIRITDAVFAGEADEEDRAALRLMDVTLFRAGNEQRIVQPLPAPSAAPVDDDDDAPLWQLRAAGRPIRQPGRVAPAAAETPEEPVLDEGSPLVAPSLPSLDQ